MDDRATTPSPPPAGAEPACCAALEGLFGERTAKLDLAAYRRRGPGGTTRRLLRMLIAQGVTGASLLDIGGGVGAIQHALLEAGASQATAVDVSSAYLEADRAEAARRGLADRLTALHGDFVALAPQVAPADIVTLERVICCYADVESLVDASAARARRLYGLVYPRDAPWTRLGMAMTNAWMRLTRSAFRFHVHRESRVMALAAAQGLGPIEHYDGWLWTVAVFRRATPD